MPRLKELYNKEIKTNLKDKFGYKNVYMVPKIQKIVLNSLSTLTMIRLNRTYGAYMVDVNPTNKKLEERAIRMISEISLVDQNKARESLIEAKNNPKLAVLIAKGLSVDKARYLLNLSKGNLREAIRKQYSIS